MSRFDSDLDHAEWLNGPDPADCPVAICVDCGREFSYEDSDVCDTCLRRRVEFESAMPDVRRA